MLPLESTFKHNRRHFLRFSRDLSRLSGGLTDYGQTPPHAASLLRIVTPTLISMVAKKTEVSMPCKITKAPSRGEGRALRCLRPRESYAMQRS
jgi:hypothetical protein